MKIAIIILRIAALVILVPLAIIIIPLSDFLEGAIKSILTPKMAETAFDPERKLSCANFARTRAG